MTEFIPGLELCELYYREAVRPILDRLDPHLPHAAGLVGFGSDVLGFDTVTSTDHMWGPRLVLFLQPQGFAENRERILPALRENLPISIRGYSTHFTPADERDGGVRCRIDIEHGPVEPLIQFTTVERFLQDELGVSPGQDLRPVDWLTFQEHRLLTITAGRVYFDNVGLNQARRRFTYYPEPLWRYLLAAQWGLISQEEAFVGRTHSVGDELGSRVIAARLVERLMRLCFLMEKRYPPYSKWFGTAFQRLQCAPRMGPLLEQVLAAPDYAQREAPLAATYSLAVELHNALGITEPLDPRTRAYSGWHSLRDNPDLPLDYEGERPYRVIFAGRLADAIEATISDPGVLALRRGLGAVNQFMVESSDALQNVPFCRGLADDLQQEQA